MDVIVVSGDHIIMWWPNGAGYDVYLVTEGVDIAKFDRIAQYEVSSGGGYVEIKKP